MTFRLGMYSTVLTSPYCLILGLLHLLIFFSSVIVAIWVCHPGDQPLPFTSSPFLSSSFFFSLLILVSFTIRKEISGSLLFATLRIPVSDLFSELWVAQIWQSSSLPPKESYSELPKTIWWVEAIDASLWKLWLCLFNGSYNVHRFAYLRS